MPQQKPLSLFHVVQICSGTKGWLCMLLATKCIRGSDQPVFEPFFLALYASLLVFMSVCLLIYWAALVFPRSAVHELWLWVMKCLRTSHSEQISAALFGNRTDSMLHTGNTGEAESAEGTVNPKNTGHPHRWNELFSIQLSWAIQNVRNPFTLFHSLVVNSDCVIHIMPLNGNKSISNSKVMKLNVN